VFYDLFCRLFSVILLLITRSHATWGTTNILARGLWTWKDMSTSAPKNWRIYISWIYSTRQLCKTKFEDSHTEKEREKMTFRLCGVVQDQFWSWNLRCILDKLRYRFFASSPIILLFCDSNVIHFFLVQMLSKTSRVTFTSWGTLEYWESLLTLLPVYHIHHMGYVSFDKCVSFERMYNIKGNIPLFFWPKQYWKMTLMECVTTFCMLRA
jgi:hypothetical protein